MSNSIKHEAFYGLPNEVKFCKKCVMSNQRPASAIEFKHTIDSKKTTMNFDEDGVCDACKTAEIKDNINWGMRESELIKLLDKHRKNDGSYDCIVPGSGGKDSAFQAHVLKYKYGMNPLTITWPPISSSTFFKRPYPTFFTNDEPFWITILSLFVAFV